jgi:hypothetical protein
MAKEQLEQLEAEVVVEGMEVVVVDRPNNKLILKNQIPKKKSKIHTG